VDEEPPFFYSRRLTMTTRLVSVAAPTYDRNIHPRQTLGWAPWIGAWGFLLTVTLGLMPLSGREAELLASTAASPWVRDVSPLAGALLRAIAAVGPPTEVLMRLLGLVALLTGGMLGGRICCELGGSRRAGMLAGGFLMTHGALVLAATRLLPGSLIWALEASLILLVLAEGRDGPRPNRRIALIVAAVVMVCLEPLTALLPLILAIWLLWSGRDWKLIVLLLSTAALGIVLAVAWGRPPRASGMRLPSLAEVVRELVAVGPWEGFHEPVHALIVVSAPTLALALLGLALTGWVRSGWPMRIVSLALLLPGVLALFLPGSDAWGGTLAALLLPALVLLAARRTDTFEPGPSGVTWFVLLIGLAGLTGVRVVTSYQHLEARAVAAYLEPWERPLVTDPGLGQAIAFYAKPRDGGWASDAGWMDEVLVKIWQPGDRTPRKIGVETFGWPLGRLWIVRSGEPLWDMSQELSSARVTYRERDREVDCPWHRERRRFSCGGPDYQGVNPGSATFDSVPLDAIYIHPLDDGVLELRWDGVPLGRRLVGLAGLDDGSLDFSTAPVAFEVQVGQRPPVELERGARRGLIPFEIDTRGGPETGTVLIRVTADDDRGRHFFLDALTVE
jgi:hypothetical protein